METAQVSQLYIIHTESMNISERNIQPSAVNFDSLVFTSVTQVEIGKWNSTYVASQTHTIRLSKQDKQ